MKKILISILVLLSVQSFGQLKLYAERRNVDNTIDSFYVSEFIADSIRTKQGVAIFLTVERLQNIGNAVYPESFGQFIKHADGIYRNARYFSGYPVSVVPIHADAGANLILTDHPNSEQPLANSQRSAVRVNTSTWTQASLTCIVMAQSASVNSPRIYFQYSADGVNWVGDGSGNNISLSSTGAKETAWVDLPAGAIGDVYIRVAMNGGNGTADPALGNVTIQLR
jgi:hypothetical protein